MRIDPIKNMGVRSTAEWIDGTEIMNDWFRIRKLSHVLAVGIKSVEWFGERRKRDLLATNTATCREIQVKFNHVWGNCGTSDKPFEKALIFSSSRYGKRKFFFEKIQRSL